MSTALPSRELVYASTSRNAPGTAHARQSLLTASAHQASAYQAHVVPYLVRMRAFEILDLYLAFMVVQTLVVQSRSLPCRSHCHLAAIASNTHHPQHGDESRGPAALLTAAL